MIDYFNKKWYYTGRKRYFQFIKGGRITNEEIY